MVWIVQLGLKWILLVILTGQQTHGIHSDNSHCFEYFNTTRTWTEASNVCRDKGGILLTDTSTNILSSLSLSLTKNITSVWVGARNVWNWTWEDGEAVNFTNWGPGEPSVDGDHIILSVKNDQNAIPRFTWKVLGGDTILSDGIISKYICQFDELSYCGNPICFFKGLNRCLNYLGRCYYIGGILGANYSLNIDKLISNTWDNARLQCDNINATLVKLFDRETQEQLELFIRQNYSDFAGDFWIGATANKNLNNWIWLSGEPVVQMKQIASQGGVKNCLLWTHEAGLKPEQCNSSHTFACQYCDFGNVTWNRGKDDSAKQSTIMADTDQGSEHLIWIVIGIPAILLVAIIVGIILYSRKEGIKPQQAELQTDTNIYETTENPMYGLKPDDPRRMGRSLLSYKGKRPFHVNSTVREKRLIFYPEKSGFMSTEALKNNNPERQIPASYYYGEVQSNGCANINRISHGSSAVPPSYRNDTYLDMTSGCINKVPRESENPCNDHRLHRFSDATLGKLDLLPESLCSRDWDTIHENNDTFVDKGIGLDFGLERMQGELAQLYQEMKPPVRKPEIRNDEYIHCIPNIGDDDYIPDSYYPLSDENLF